MKNFIIIAIVTAIVASIIVYLIKEKKKGSACIGCPYAKQCSGHCNTGNEYNSLLHKHPPNE